MHSRFAQIHRKTNETEISIQLNLDGNGEHQISTGIGMLDHLLTHLSVHGLFDIQIQAIGDLHIDTHHTIEDIAISLGQAFDQALGKRQGINRMGHAYVPMDESLAFVAIDFSGRPYTIFKGEWTCAIVGNIPTTLAAHFLESFAMAARCNLHGRILYGKDDHHKIEALFKALGRALAMAVSLDARSLNKIPSSKGSIG